MPIKFYIIAILLPFCFVTCHQKKETEIKNLHQEKQLIKPSSAKLKKASSDKIVPLTNDNLISILSDYGKNNPETIVLMKTPKGNMKIKLYENTPMHRANFIRLIKNNFYKGTQFYRVINNFMIQGGDSDDWERQSLKQKMGSYTLPAEFHKENIHQKGALSMAREYENNPEKRSVPFEFFIIQGYSYTTGELLGAEKHYGLNIIPEHKNIYSSQGGCPHLDGQHTVFGQVIEGLNIIDSIAAVKVDAGDWPIEDITIEFQILK